MAGVAQLKVCTICGDRAAGYNFGSVTCESCKAFFRRASRKAEVPECQFSGNCVPTVKTRRFCSACRLRMCESAGMKKCLVLNEEQRKQRLDKINDNRRRKASLDGRSTMPSIPVHHLRRADGMPAIPAMKSARLPLLAVRMPTEVALLPEDCTVLVCHGATSSHVVSSDNGIIDSSNNCSTSSSSTSSGLAELVTDVVIQDSRAATAIFQPPVKQLPVAVNGHAWGVVTQGTPKPLPLPMALSASTVCRRLLPHVLTEIRGLSCLYRSKLTTACASLACQQQLADHGSNVSDFEQFVGYLSRLAVQYVLFSRELPRFSHLPVVAQMCLTKAGISSFIMLRAAEIFDLANDSWVDELGVIVPASIVDIVATSLNSIDRNSYFSNLSSIRKVIPLGADGRPDQTVLALMQAIGLLSPERMNPEAIDPDTIVTVAEHEQHYCHLLRQYLEAAYSFEAAAMLWPRLAVCVAACKRFGICQGGILMSCDAIRRDELLRELLGDQATVP